MGPYRRKYAEISAQRYAEQRRMAAEVARQRVKDDESRARCEVLGAEYRAKRNAAMRRWSA
jgi:hypothetical protein